MTGPLVGRTVVVTRAAGQAGPLVGRLAGLGAEVVEVPVVATVDPPDGGSALRDALTRSYDWIVVTSPNGASRLLAGLGPDPGGAVVAAIGPGTAAVLRDGGVEPALVPLRSIAEGLLEAFPDPPAGGGDVLVVQAEAARPVLVDGLRRAGWEVHPVAGYRTAAVTPAASVLAAAAGADAVTFTSGSTVRAFVAAAGPGGVPPVVVCIGPETAAAAQQAGLTVAAVADPHTLDGLVAAVRTALA